MWFFSQQWVNLLWTFGRNRDITSVTYLWAHRSEVCIPPALCCVLRQGEFCTVTLLLPTRSQAEEGYWESGQWYLGSTCIELEMKSVKWLCPADLSLSSCGLLGQRPMWNLDCSWKKAGPVHWRAGLPAHGYYSCSKWSATLLWSFLNKREFNFRNMKYSHIITHQVVGNTCRKQST